MTKNKLERRERILNSPSYWVEKVNLSLYHAIIKFMESENLNQKELADYLEISPSRVSQILNSGEVNYSLDKIASISIKLGFYPDFRFVEKNEFLVKESRDRDIQSTMRSFTSLLIERLFTQQPNTVGHLYIAKGYDCSNVFLGENLKGAEKVENREIFTSIMNARDTAAAS